MSPAKHCRGPFWSLIAYFALALDTMITFNTEKPSQNITIEGQKWTKSLIYLLQLLKIPMYQQYINFQNAFFHILSFAGTIFVLCKFHFLKSFCPFHTIFHLWQRIIDHSLSLEFLSVKCDFICDCQIFSFLIEIFPTEIEGDFKLAVMPICQPPPWHI